MSRVRVLSGVLTTAPGAVLPGSELQVFVHHYNDERPVTARPDAPGRRVTAADIAIATVGAHVVGTRPARAGEFDALLWTAAQFGSWYEQDHRGFGMSAEAGYQWPRAAWSPWLRGGISWFSGDDAPADATHGTFFPMLPTVRRYSQSTLYSLANLRDVTVQLMLRPRSSVEQDDSEDRDRLVRQCGIALDCPQRGRNRCGEEKHNDEYILELSEESTPCRGRLLGSQLVAAVALASRPNVLVTEAEIGVAPQRRDDLINSLAVRNTGVWRFPRGGRHGLLLGR